MAITMNYFMAALLLALPVLAVPTPEDGTVNARAPSSTIRMCSNANGEGRCIRWTQESHCWNFNDRNLQIYENAVSSVYPEDPLIIWTLHDNYDCKGTQLDIQGKRDNLVNNNFNDKASSLRWRLA